MQNLYYVEECGSTNDEVLNFLNGNGNDISAVYTFHQRKGRGQYGNVWESQKNLNIAISFAINVKHITVSDSLFNFYTATVFRNFIASLTEKQVVIKWPNDIIIAGKKISGILIEKKKWHNQFFYIIGIGINVLQTNFENFPKAGSLYTQTDEKFDLTVLAEKWYCFFKDRFFQSKSSKEILDEYNQSLFGKNSVYVFAKKGIRQNGIIRYADEDGYLWIDLEKDGFQKFFFKEIEMLY